MHLIAEWVILEGLIKLGILKGNLDEMINNRIAWVFMPHGLGH